MKKSSISTIISKNHSLIICISILFAILLRLAYLNYTNYDQRGYDANEHLAYIEFVANNLRLPPPDQGWEYHQAPLYYITAATIYKFSATKLKSLQILSLLYSAIFLIYGVLIMQFLLKNKLLSYSASLLILFWPSGVIHSIRIGNDPMYYMMSCISLYYLIKWLSLKQEKYFYFTVIFTSLNMTVKLNGITLLAIVILTFLYKSLKTKKIKTSIKPTSFLIVAVLLTCSLSFSRDINSIISQKNFNIINGNTGKNMNRALSVHNNLQNYLSFSPNIYFNQTFTTPWEDKGGRQYFWNYLLKTMLFGEFSYVSPFKFIFANIINIFSLEIIIVFVIGLFYISRNLTQTNAVFLGYLLLSLASLIYYRHSFPFSSNEDFRFIFPTIIPFIYFYSLGIEALNKYRQKILVIFYYSLSIIITVCTCCFFLIPLIQPQ